MKDKRDPSVIFVPYFTAFKTKLYKLFSFLPLPQKILPFTPYLPYFLPFIPYPEKPFP